MKEKVGLSDFIVRANLGKGSFGSVVLIKPKFASANAHFAMKVLEKQKIVERHQVTSMFTLIFHLNEDQQLEFISRIHVHVFLEFNLFYGPYLFVFTI